MNLRPMEVRDNPAVAQLIRASLEEFGLDKPGTVYFDSHLDHLADYYQHQERAAYFVLKMKDSSLDVVALHLCLIRLPNYKNCMSLKTVVARGIPVG